MQRHERESSQSSAQATERAGDAPQQATKPVSLRQESAPALVKATTSTSVPEPPRRSTSLHSAPASDPAASFVESTARTLQGAVSGYLGLARTVRTTLCQICFDNVPVADTVQLTACRHQYCRSCLKRYLELKITEGNVFPVCFHPVGHATAPVAISNSTTATCGTRIDDAQLQAIVDQDVWSKCTLFRFSKANATARECPFCCHPQECAGPEEPECTCENCGRAFCFFHGNAHVDGSCADYELKNAESETQTRATIARVAKPCPGCKSNVEKSGGCNHMTCVVCRTDFCWICNTKLELDGVTDHYNSMSLTGCGGRQFDVVDVNGQSPWLVRFCRTHDAVNELVVLRVRQTLSILAYPLAVAFAVLVTALTSERPTEAITAAEFLDLVESVRAGLAFVGLLNFFFRVVPRLAFNVYTCVQLAKVFAEIGLDFWSFIQPHLLALWLWARARGNQLGGYLRSPHATNA